MNVFAIAEVAALLVFFVVVRTAAATATAR